MHKMNSVPLIHICVCICLEQIISSFQTMYLYSITFLERGNVLKLVTLVIAHMLQVRKTELSLKELE